MNAPEPQTLREALRELQGEPGVRQPGQGPAPKADPDCLSNPGHGQETTDE